MGLRQSLGHGGLVRTYTSSLLGPHSLGASTCRGNMATRAQLRDRCPEEGLAFHRCSIKSQPFGPLTSEGTPRWGVLCRNEGPGTMVWLRACWDSRTKESLPCAAPARPFAVVLPARGAV